MHCVYSDTFASLLSWLLHHIISRQRWRHTGPCWISATRFFLSTKQLFIKIAVNLQLFYNMSSDWLPTNQCFIRRHSRIGRSIRYNVYTLRLRQNWRPVCRRPFNSINMFGHYCNWVQISLRLVPIGQLQTNNIGSNNAWTPYRQPLSGQWWPSPLTPIGVIRRPRWVDVNPRSGEKCRLFVFCF